MAKLFKEVYRVVENPKEEDAAIEIVSGEFEGLVYQYGRVQFVENKNHLNFERTIRRLPEGGDMDELLNNDTLQTLMGDILVELMEEQIKRDKESEQGNTERTD
tara:strand:- start:1003 stop:1314 length:312 start_codon:yes stop_codon:yes gene_type:complete